jgi:hypothetical protein
MTKRQPLTCVFLFSLECGRRSVNAQTKMASYDSNAVMQRSRLMMKTYANCLMGKIVENICMDTHSLYLDDSELPELISDSSESDSEISDSEPPSASSGTDSDSD